MKFYHIFRNSKASTTTSHQHFTSTTRKAKNVQIIHYHET